MTETEARNKLYRIAKSYVGSNQYSSNHVELVSIFNSVKPDGYTLKRSDPWCAGGLSAATIQAFGKAVAKKYFPLSAGCPMMITKAKKLGIWIENDAHKPKFCEWILYDWDDSGRGNNTGNPDHVGLVVEVNGSTINVLEFNHHGSVGYREIEVNGTYIRGFIAPDYADVAKALSSGSSTAPKKSNTEIAKEVIAGKWGNGDARITKLKAAGYDYAAVQAEVNKLLTPTPSKKSNTEIAREVLAGKWGNGADRKKKLEAAGYSYSAVQNEVNKLLSDKNNVVKYKTLYAMNVRTGNSTKSKVINVIQKGIVVEANKIKNNWLYSNKYGGWICIKDSNQTYMKKVN